MQGDRHYDYHAYGNLIRERRGTGQRLVTEYRYDCQHRLIGVSLPGGSIEIYKYDAFGRRIEKTVDGRTTEFPWQGERLIAESAENRYRSYIYEPGTFRPLALLDGEGPWKAGSSTTNSSTSVSLKDSSATPARSCGREVPGLQ